ncbi:stAR-related lipid transfer protein 9 [Clarias gariepinus]|uniref:stAR-related lipid transfer protein 9 n=1 Tax=Clarias gariepinus TaxID=13013 RepID=UPI00234D09C1|nr:stAR-related lipid transfer protein 9 [Clarias gariepinus]
MANVKVAIRVRPLNSRESVDEGKIAVQVEGKVVRVRNVKLDGRLDGRPEAPGDSRERQLEFGFDYCYWSVNPDAPNYASQEDVFQDLGMCVLAGATEGYNVCLFAYGQTGSGKTYTMMGNPDSIGLTPRICQGLFRSGMDSPDGQNCRVEISFLEIYNERVRDLLRGADQKKPAALRVREHPEKGPYVQGLTQHVVEDYKQAADLLEEGIANRITAATHIHDASSRSHAIFSIQYTQAILENNLPSEIVSKINLVDLAGSERADPNYCKDRITEGANINKSLVTLGIVISALAQNSQMCSSSQSINSMLSEGEVSTVGSQSSSLSSSSRRHCFIPYRDSVLTWLLKDSLGGNSKTIMIAAISPSCSSYSETLSTLRYAAHAKNIVNKPRVNEDASVRLIRELREEIDRLKSMLLSFSMRNPSPSLSDERDSSLSDIVLQNELKVEQLTKDWSESWRDKRALLEQYSVDINQDRAGVQIQSLQPHLVSLEPDVLSTGVTIYHLREGITRIGPQDPNKNEVHIVMPDGTVCEIENQNGVVSLKPLPHTACTVNGREVTEPCRLAQGAVIILGGHHKFRFNHPAEAAVLRERRRIVEGGPLLSSSKCNILTPDSRAEEVGSQEDSDRLAPWQRLEEHQRYVECLREEILLEQKRVEKDLEREQAHLQKQRSEIQQWILQEKQRLAAIREKGTLDSGVQTDVISLPVLAVSNENENNGETVRPSLIVGDRKRVVQEELLKHHALRRHENRIRRKRLRYQMERIARKRHLLEAKQELQRLEAALSQGGEGTLSPDLASPSKRRGRPMILRRHSFSVDLLSRLYPQHTPIFSQFLRRNRLSESTSSLPRFTIPKRWVSDECLPDKPRGRSNTMPSRCSHGTSSRTGSSENIAMLIKENMASKEMGKRKTLGSPLQSSIFNHNISVKTTADSDNGNSKKVLPIIKQSSTQKLSPKGEKSSPHEENKGLEKIRKALSRSVGFGIKMALSRVSRKPPLGSRGGKNAKSASRIKAQFAMEVKKEKIVEDNRTKQPKSTIKSAVSCDGLDQLILLKEKNQGRWHSAEILTQKTRSWVKTQQDLTNWEEDNGDDVADDSSDCDSLFSVDSLSSAYATALAKQLQQEDCEPSEAESEDSQMSKDSLVKRNSGSIITRPGLKLNDSIGHTSYSPNPQSTTDGEKIEKDKEMPEELFGEKTKQVIKESSQVSQLTSDSWHSSDASVRETEVFLALTDAWSSTDAAESPRILGASETISKLCIRSETSSSQSQASLDLSGATIGSECQISPCFDSTQGKYVTVKEQSQLSFERERVLDNFLNEHTSTSCSTPECTLLQENNGMLGHFESTSSSEESSITLNTLSNKTLCLNKPPSTEAVPSETDDVHTLVASAPSKENAFSGCFQGKSPDKNSISNFTKQTAHISSGDECVLIESIALQSTFTKSQQETNSEETRVAETPFRDSNIFLKCDEQTVLEISTSHSTLQSGNTLKNSNRQNAICSSEELHQSAIDSLKIENDFLCKTQTLMKHLITHVEKDVSDGKPQVQHIEKCSEQYGTINAKDYLFEMNIKSDSVNEVADHLKQCVQLEHETCNVHSRKRSKGSQDDLASNLQTPKRSCVEPIVKGDSAVNNAPFTFIDNSKISRDLPGKLLPTEKITANLSKTFQQDFKNASTDNHISTYQKSNSLVANYTSGDQPVSTVLKEQRMSTILMGKSEVHSMQEVKFPDFKVVDKGVFDCSPLQKNGITINDEISEVVKEHLNMSLQVHGGKDINEEPETNDNTSSATNMDVFKNKNKITAEKSQGEPGSPYTILCVNEYSVDNRVNVDNTYDCVGDKYFIKDPTKKQVVSDHQGFHSSCPSLLVKNISAEIKNSDHHNSYGSVPETNTVLGEVPTNNNPESISTSHTNILTNKLKSESNKNIQRILSSSCEQSPEVILSSDYLTVDEEHDQSFLMESETEPINKAVHNPTPTGTSVRMEVKEFYPSSYTQQKPGIYPEENNTLEVSKDVCDVSVSSNSSALVDDVASEMLKEAAKSMKAGKENMTVKFQQVAELNSVAHLYTESASPFQKNSDRAENVQGTASRPLEKQACHECAEEKYSFIAQDKLHPEPNTKALNETKDKIVDLENHTCSGKLHKETTVSKSCQAFCTLGLQRDNQKQIIQGVKSSILGEKPCFQNEDQTLRKEDHMLNKKKVQEQCVNVQKEKKHPDNLQDASQDISLISKSVQRTKQTDMREANKLEHTFSECRPLNPKDPHQVKIESTDKANGGKQHTAIITSRLVFSRTNEEPQRVKPKRYRKAHFTAPLSSSTDSTPDSSMDEIAKSPRVIATPVIPGIPAPPNPVMEDRHSFSDESSTSLSLEVNLGSISKHNQSYGTGSDNLYPYSRGVNTDSSEEVRQKKCHLAAKSFQISGQSKKDETIQLTISSSTKHIPDENNHERRKSVENNSIQHKEPILHFGSSDINPFVHTKKNDLLLNAAHKNQPFGSALNIPSQLSSFECSGSGIARCCSMDNGLNVQNSPFNSHLSTYAVHKGLSSTLSSAADSKEHISTQTELMGAFHSPIHCNEKISTALGNDSCNDTLYLASSSGQVDEIMLVYSSEHESQEHKQDSRKCNQGTQTVKFYEALEKRNRHQRSSTQVPSSKPTHGTSTTWTSLQNMSDHLSELIVSTSDLLGNIQCMRTGESSMKNGPPLKTFSIVSKVPSNKYCKSDGSTQTAKDVGIQTEDFALQIKQSEVLQSTPFVQNPKAHEVNVIVKVIGSEVCNEPRQSGVIRSLKDQYDSRQNFETIKSMPDLRSGGSISSEQFGGKLDTLKILSLETVAPNQHCFSPATVEHRSSVCAQRKSDSQMLAKNNLAHQQIKPKNHHDKKVLLIDRASSPILTVDVKSSQKGKIKSDTIQTPTETFSKSVKCPPENKPVSTSRPISQHHNDHFYTHQAENKSVSSMSHESISNHCCLNVSDAYTTEGLSSRYIQNVKKKHSHEVQGPLSHSHSWQPAPLSQNTSLQSSTPINQSHRSNMQECKHRPYKDVSCWSDLSKDTLQYHEEDSVSLAPSDCNTDILVSINPHTETSPLQEDYWIPENLPMHNKFTNWSGISHQPPARLNEKHLGMEKSTNMNTNSLLVQSESLRLSNKPELLESSDRRTKEIERLRKEREQVLSSMQLDLSSHPLSVELTEAKLHYSLGKTDTLLKMLKSSSRTESTTSTKQQLYDRHRRSIDSLRKEREDLLQTSRRARSLSPSKHPNLSHQTTEQSQRPLDLPTRQREYLQHLRREVVEMSRVPDPPKREGQYPTDIEFLLRDYGRAREEAKTEIAKARVRLRERTEQEKRRLEQQAHAQSVKDHLRLCTRISNSTLCTGSNLSLSSGPTSGYNSSNTALLKDGTSPSIQITGISDKELKVRSRPPLKAPRAWLSVQDIRVENSSSGHELHSSSSPSSPPCRQRACSFSSPTSISISYQNIADCTLTSAISEVYLASGGDVRNLLAGSAEAGWRYQGLENGVQTFHRPSSRPSAHGFLGAMELQRPLGSVWSLIRDHSKTHLYNKSLKSAWTRVLDDTSQLVYLLTDPTNCHMKQPRDFCCLSTESKRDDMWVLAMQSVFDESLPRPSVDTVRGEMFPSAWILKRTQRQGREIVTVIYLLQVDLGTPSLPQRLLNVVAKKQAAVIADLDSFLSL